MRANTYLNIDENGRIDFAKIFGVASRAAPFRKDDDGLAELGDSSSNTSRHISHLAGMIVEAKPDVSRQEALDWLLHTKSGQALVARTKRQKEQTMPETFSKMVADMGVTRVCKAICERGFSTAISEQELTSAITDHAKSIYPELRPDQAFSKFFQANEVVRRAHQIVKGYVPAAQQAGVTTVGAYAELMAKADALRKQDSSLSEAQAFSKIFSDPANRDLAARERSENRPVA
jgi:hypothetical protein